MNASDNKKVMITLIHKNTALTLPLGVKRDLANGIMILGTPGTKQYALVNPDTYTNIITSDKGYFIRINKLLYSVTIRTVKSYKEVA